MPCFGFVSGHDFTAPAYSDWVEEKTQGLKGLRENSLRRGIPGLPLGAFPTRKEGSNWPEKKYAAQASEHAHHFQTNVSPKKP
jgi:hypothetical protein